MLPTIKLDDQMCRQAHEVHDVSSKRILSPKFAPCQLLATQEIPQATFGIGRCISQYFEHASICVAWRILRTDVWLRLD